MSSRAVKNKNGLFKEEILDIDERIKRHDKSLQRIYFKQLTKHVSELFESKNTIHYQDVSDVVVSFLSLSKKKCKIDIEDFRDDPGFKLALRRELS